MQIEVGRERKRPCVMTLQLQQQLTNYAQRQVERKAHVLWGRAGGAGAGTRHRCCLAGTNDARVADAAAEIADDARGRPWRATFALKTRV